MSRYRTAREIVAAEGVWDVARGAYEVRDENGESTFYYWSPRSFLTMVLVRSPFVLIGVLIAWVIAIQFVGWSEPHPNEKWEQLEAAIGDRYNAEVWPLPDDWDGSQDYEVEAVQDYRATGEYWQDPLHFWDCILHPGEHAQFLRLRCPDPVTGVLVELPEGGARVEDGPVYRLKVERDGRPVTLEELVGVLIDDPLWDLYMSQESQ